MSAAFSSQFNRDEAIVHLIACQHLAGRLAAEGLNLTLEQADYAILEGFKKVWLAGYLDGSSHIYRQAGLKRRDLAALHRLLARAQNEHMRQQQQEGNN